MPGVIGNLSTVAFQINACKTSPDLITRPLITHVAGGRRRRRVVGLGAERQGGGQFSQDLLFCNNNKGNMQSGRRNTHLFVFLLSVRIKNKEKISQHVKTWQLWSQYLNSGWENLKMQRRFED